MNEDNHRGGLAWPILLISAGLILLLNNLGVSDVSLWEMAIKLWPAALIAFGLDLLIPRRSIWGFLLAFVLIAAVLAGGFWLVENGGPRQTAAIPISQGIHGADRATISLDQAVGELKLVGRDGAQELINGVIRQRDRSEPDMSASEVEGTLEFELHDGQRRFGPVDFSLGSRSWSLEVSREIPFDLEADLGVGLATLDLSNTKVESINGNFGVGRMELQLPASPGLNATIDGGVGEVLIRVPVGASVEIRLDRGLSTLQLPPGYLEQGGVIRSGAAPASREPIQIFIDMGVGSIRIVEME